MTDLPDTVHAILRAVAELSREQAALDQDRERAMRRAIMRYRKLSPRFGNSRPGPRGSRDHSQSKSASRPAPTH